MILMFVCQIHDIYYSLWLILCHAPQSYGSFCLSCYQVEIQIENILIIYYVK